MAKQKSNKTKVVRCIVHIIPALISHIIKIGYEDGFQCSISRTYFSIKDDSHRTWNA